MKWFVCITLLAIGLNGCTATQNAEFRERAEIYSSNVPPDWSSNHLSNVCGYCSFCLSVSVCLWAKSIGDFPIINLKLTDQNKFCKYDWCEVFSLSRKKNSILPTNQTIKWHHLDSNTNTNNQMLSIDCISIQ